jgi:hypothetical protein
VNEKAAEESVVGDRVITESPSRFAGEATLNVRCTFFRLTGR